MDKIAIVTTSLRISCSAGISRRKNPRQAPIARSVKTSESKCLPIDRSVFVIAFGHENLGGARLESDA